MKLYKFEVIPLSSFFTPIKGDMLFGFFNYWWDKKDNKILENIVFSDFLPKDFLYKPALPMKYFEVDEDKKKEFKKIKFIHKDSINDLSKIFENKLVKKIEGEEKEVDFITKKLKVQNSLHRLKLSTDEKFSVYGIEEYFYNYPIDLYIAYDKDIKEIEEFLNEIGKYGIGKKSQGKFQVKFIEEVNLKKSKYGMNLSPLIIDNKKIKYYELFTRYGKYFDSKTPFKKYVLMYESGSIVEMDDFIMGENRENGYSKTSIIQGKSIIYPIDINLKDNDED